MHESCTKMELFEKMCRKSIKMNHKTLVFHYCMNSNVSVRLSKHTFPVMCPPPTDVSRRGDT